MIRFLKTVFTPTHSSSMWRPMLTLSFASLAGMVILMVTIIWQMHSNIVSERKQVVRAQVITALAMVERIHAEQKQGNLTVLDAQRMALTHLEAMEYPDSGYFWVINNDGVMLMHPYSKDLIGKSAIDLSDVKGEPFVKRFLVTARAGGGFTSYDWPRPVGGEPASKIAYVVPFKPWNWVIGSGLYVDDLLAESVRQISLGAVLIFLLFSLNIGISLHLSRRFMREFHDNAIHDDLTDLFTRSHLHEVGSRMMYRASIEGGTPLAAIFLDLDHFKKINDDFGHKVGDSVLITVSDMIRKGLRPNELAFRYGGEELAVLLHAAEEDCYNIAERIRTAIKKHQFSIAGSKFNITLSAGVAVARRDEALSDLLRRADQCMYMAKKSGRDCTVVESELDTRE